MIIITGSIVASPQSFEELRSLSLDHVRHSRSEPGCLSHAVHVDAENPLRLFFFETWADEAAVQAHFALRKSREFVKAARKLAVEPPTIQTYTAEQNT